MESQILEERPMDFLTDAIAKLSAVPSRVDELTRGLTDEQLSWKPSPDIFSIRENIMHLRDIDDEGYSKRIPMILDEEHPSLPDVNGRKLASERRYNAQPLQPALDDLRTLRAASVARLKQCSAQELDRKAEMQGVGTINLRRLLELWIEHDAGHVQDLAELRRAIESGADPEFAQHKAA
jgi:hypothetical protein